MTDLYRDLAWLLRAPPDFRQRCRAAGDSADAAELIALARYALDENQLRKLAAAIERVRAVGNGLAPLVPLRLGVVGNATLEPLISALVATAVRYGLDLTCVSADYGQIVQEAVDPDSRMNRARLDVVLIALDYRGLPIVERLHEADAAEEAARGACEFVRRLAEAFRMHSGATSIVQTAAAPAETLFGSFDRVLGGTTRSIIAGFNDELMRWVAQSNELLLDSASLAETVGLARWHSPTQWNVAKLPFHAEFLPLYADHVCRLLAAYRGKSRKCLVLDLDNTVWGGVIGDDGMSGISLAQGDASGEAYLSVQRAALALRERGIVLAVSSKNDDEVARAPFRDHPDMLLREEHIAVFQANWKDKATNIAAIADTLSLGLDSIVFLDDNPAERSLVRDRLPQVAVPELPNDPALYARTLAAGGYFEAVVFSAEDRQRAKFYADNAQRVALLGETENLEQYLASLDMRIVFRPFDAAGRSRIAQLINKSNQFNLTTRRYSEADVEEMERDPSCFTIAVRLIDRFGDNGMISVVICRAVGSATWEIDTWLMSCRVLGRRVEHMLLGELLSRARERGVETLIGVYLPTDRNAMVADFYKRLGFDEISDQDGAGTRWSIRTDAEIDAVPMAVDSAGLSPSLV